MNNLKKIKVNSKNLGQHDGIEVYLTNDLYERLEKDSTKDGTNLLTLFSTGRALRGFKHLIETIKAKSTKKIIFNLNGNSQDDESIYIDYDQYRASTSSRFFSLYRQTGLDGANFYLNKHFPEEFEYDKDQLSEAQIRKVDNNLPKLLGELSKKAKNKKVILNQTTEVVKNLREQKGKLKKDVESLEALQRESNISIFQNTLDEFEERLKKTYSETKGVNSWQSWIYKNNWLFGTRYQEPIERQRIGFGSIPDYLFPTIDGFLDILEIKLPTHYAIISDDSHPGSYRWSGNANAAIGQVVNYLHQIDLNQFQIQEQIKENYGFELHVIKPRAFILVGRDADWKVQELKALRKLNFSLHGIEVLTYDELLRRGNQLIEIYSSKDIFNSRK